MTAAGETPTAATSTVMTATAMTATTVAATAVPSTASAVPAPRPRGTLRQDQEHRRQKHGCYFRKSSDFHDTSPHHVKSRVGRRH